MTIPNQPPYGQPRIPYPPQYTAPVPKRSISTRLRESTMFHVAVTAAAGAVAAYYGTTKVVRQHAVDVYFEVSEDLDAALLAAAKKSKKSKKKD